MKILVTGASGFVGGNVWRSAVRREWEVLATGRRILRDPNYVSVDLARPFKLDFRPDVVVHAAARSSPWGSRREFEAQNVTATRHIVEFCKSSGNPHLIYISTGAVLYRNQHQFGMNEETPVPESFVNEYSRAKYMGEQIVAKYPGDWCILRPRAVFGPGDTVVFPRILRSMKKGRLPLVQSDQTVVGDLVYIDTLVEYINRAIERRATGIYNITNNQPVEIYAFLERIARELNLPLPRRKISVSGLMRMAGVLEAIYRMLPFLGEPPLTRFSAGVLSYSKTFDVSRCLRDLGTPLVSIDEGLERFIDWQREQL